jgi:hypothetical protein
MALMLEIRQIRFEAICTKPAELSGNIGNVLRGSFGNTLMWLARSYDSTLQNTYSEILGKVFKNTEPSMYHPHSGPTMYEPYAFDCSGVREGSYCVGDELAFTLVLMGEKCCFAENVITAVKLMLTGNVGGNIDSFALLAAIEEANGGKYFDSGSMLPLPASWEWNDSLSVEKPIKEIEIIFPGRVLPNHLLNFKRQKAYQLSFSKLMEAVLRRLEGLCIDHQKDRNCSCDEWDMLLSLARDIDITESDLRIISTPLGKSKNYKQSRYPEYFEGRVKYRGVINPFFSYIDACSILGIGRNTVLGYGRFKYRIE